MEKKSLRILIISQYFWPENFRLNDLVRFLSEKNHDIEILTGIPNYPDGKAFKEFVKHKKKFTNFNGCKIYRVNHLLRKRGTFIDLFLNFLTFFISSIFFSFKNLKSKRYDYILVFGTTPITTAFIGLILSNFTNSKVILWVLDLWPEVLIDLKVLKNKYLKKFLSNTINYIYKKTDIILCQSEGFIQKIKTKSKKILFYTWPENISLKTKIKTDYSKNLNILFAGNMGQAQNLDLVIKSAKKLRYHNVVWHFVGGGRYKDKITKYSKKFNLTKVKFYNYQKLENMNKYFDQADVLLLPLIKGSGTSNTIPGKFQTYLLARKPILCHADGIVSNYVKNFKLGLISSPNNQTQFNNNILKLYYAKQKKKLKKFTNQKNIDYLLRKFSKDNILNDLNNYIIKNKPLNEIKCVTKKTFNIIHQKNFIMSALNLAFLGSLVEKKFSLNKNIICWPDGIMTKFIFNVNINKVPGRDIIENLKLERNENLIQVIGNLTTKNILYLKKKFPNKKIVNIPLPYGTIDDLKKSLKNRVRDGLIFLTLPTPKQEIIAIYLSKKLKRYKIYCIGGAINMLSGEEAPVPKIMEENFEFLWRLRFDTKRRLVRLIRNFIYLLYGLIFNKLKLNIRKV